MTWNAIALLIFFTSIQVRFHGRPSPEKQSPYFTLAQHPPQFLESKEGYESEKYDHASGKQFMPVFTHELIQTSH